ncbi:MAG: DUF262 domain-containing protein [candidate division WOR-3 bacterium]
MEARERQVKDWLTRVRTGQILLPRFQRFEAWGYNIVADFLTSVLRDLPVGASLVLGVGSEELPFKSRAIVGAPEKGERVTELLLDGQQRLTALWRALTDNYPDTTYLVNIEDRGNPEVIAITRWEKQGRKFPLWVDIPKDCWVRKVIPFRLLNPDDERTYQEWADKASDNDPQVAREIEHVIIPLRSRLSSFNLPFLYLPSNTPKDVAIDVFVKLNTTLVKLKAFDIIVAQIEEAAGESLHDLVESLKSSVPAITHYIEPSDVVLSVGALFQDKPPDQRGYFSLELERFIGDWPNIVAGTKECVQFLESEKIIDGERLPIESVLAPLIALWAEAPEHADERGNTRILLRKYLWRALFTKRYDRSVPSAILQDYRILRKVIRGKAKETEVPCFDQDKYPLPTEEEIIQSRWPKYKDRLARALLLLSIRGGAEDIKDGTPLSVTNIQQRSYHHLFPRAWLREKKPDAVPDRALNCILISRKSNSEISAKEPVKYLLETCEASDLGENEIRRRLKTYYVDFDLLAKGDYDEFLKEKAKASESAIESLCKGENWRP